MKLQIKSLNTGKASSVNGWNVELKLDTRQIFLSSNLELEPPHIESVEGVLSGFLQDGSKFRAEGVERNGFTSKGDPQRNSTQYRVDRLIIGSHERINETTVVREIEFFCRTLDDWLQEDLPLYSSKIYNSTEDIHIYNDDNGDDLYLSPKKRGEMLPFSAHVSLKTKYKTATQLSEPIGLMRRHYTRMIEMITGHKAHTSSYGFRDIQNNYIYVIDPSMWSRSYEDSKIYTARSLLLPGHFMKDSDNLIRNFMIASQNIPTVVYEHGIYLLKSDTRNVEPSLFFILRSAEGMYDRYRIRVKDAKNIAEYRPKLKKLVNYVSIDGHNRLVTKNDLDILKDMRDAMAHMRFSKILESDSRRVYSLLLKMEVIYYYWVLCFVFGMEPDDIKGTFAKLEIVNDLLNGVTKIYKE